MPGGQGSYPLDEIFQWRVAYERAQGRAAAANAEAQQKAAEYDLAKLESEARIKAAEAAKRERLEEAEQGNVLPRDELELAVHEIITLTRDRFLALPKALCRAIPKKYHAALREEGTREVARILEEFARLLEDARTGETA